MNSIKTIAFLAVLAIGVSVTPAFALDADNSYLLDDFEFISLLIEIDSDGNANFEEVFITPEGIDTPYIMDSNASPIVRISSDHTSGKIFGQTTDGDYALILYEITGEDTVTLKAKVWADDGVERVISNGEITPLF